MAERLGQPLMPWQRLVADVGGEINPETGLPAYREVIVTVPRQSGKTTLVLAWEVQRAVGWDIPQRVVYSAQTGNDARKKLIEDQVPILEPRKRTLGISRILRGMGNEAVEFRNGSRLSLLASTADSGHGKTVHLAVKDELFADYDDRRDQTLVPAMMTVASAQSLTTSTMGTDESVALNRAVERGRAAVDAGKTAGVAYFEWSAHPADDPDDPATWWACMPALGVTVTEDVVRHARLTMSHGEFVRAFLNLRTRGGEERIIPQTVWDAVCKPDAAPAGPAAFGLDMNPERNAAAIAAAAGGVVELVDHRPGAGWLVDAACRLSQANGRPVFYVDAKGPAGTLIPDLEREGLSVHSVTPGEMVQACGQFFDGVVDRTFTVRSHPKFDEAVAVAAKRTVQDSWAWTRRGASGDISPLVAATVALWGSRNGEGPSVYESRGAVVLG